jgi:glycerophosphoryl diester phosphodiesterase
MKIWVRLLLSLILILVAWMLYRLVTIKPLQARPLFRDSGRVWVIAHRGGAGLAPENTMVAFRNAVSMGVDMLEMDVHMTGDGHIVVIHDDTVDRTTDGVGRIEEMTLEEVKELDAGYRFTPDGGMSYPYRGKGVTIPTLNEVLSAFPDARMSIEIKPDDIAVADKTVSLVKAHGAEGRVLLVSFHNDVVHRVRALAPEIVTGASRKEMYLFWGMTKLRLWRLYRPVPDVLQLPESWKGQQVVTPTIVGAAHKLGMKVQVWTVDDPAEMRKLIDEGVDGIITDRPDLMLKLESR